MILQTSKGFRFLPWADNGCAAMSALWYVAKRGKLPDSAQGIEEDVMHMVFAGLHSDEVSPISDILYVNMYDAIAKWYNIKVLKPARHEDARYTCGPLEEEILEFRNHGRRHFTAGNGTGIVTYDPLGYWEGFAGAKLVSKRIITWSRYTGKPKGDS